MNTKNSSHRFRSTILGLAVLATFLSIVVPGGGTAAAAQDLAAGTGALVETPAPPPPGLSPFLPGGTFTYFTGDTEIAGTDHNQTAIKGVVNVAGNFNLVCYMHGDGNHGGKQDKSAIVTLMPTPGNAVAAVSCPPTSDALTVQCNSAVCVVYVVF